MRRFYLLLALATVQTQYGIFREEEVLLGIRSLLQSSNQSTVSPLTITIGLSPSKLAWHFLVHALSGTMLANQWYLLCDPSFLGHASQRGCPGNFILTLFTLLVTDKRDSHYVRSEFCVWRIPPYDF